MLVEYAETMDRFNLWYVTELKARERLPHMTKEELVDVAIVAREIARVLNDCRRQCDGLLDLCSRLACVKWVAETQNETGDASTCIHGSLGRGTPDVKEAVTVPSREKNPDEYYRMMKALGAVTAAKKDLVRPHWPGLTEHISNLMKQGKRVPDGVDPRKTYHLYKLSPLTRAAKVDLEVAARAAQEDASKTAKERRQSNGQGQGGKGDARQDGDRPDWES